MQLNKLALILKHLLIKAILVFTLVMMALPSGYSGFLTEVTFAVYVFLFTLGGSFSFLYAIHQDNSQLSLMLMVFLLVSILPIILLTLWYQSDKHSNILMHIATTLWVIIGGFATFGMAISAI